MPESASTSLVSMSSCQRTGSLLYQYQVYSVPVPIPSGSNLCPMISQIATSSVHYTHQTKTKKRESIPELSSSAEATNALIDFNNQGNGWINRDRGVDYRK